MTTQALEARSERLARKVVARKWAETVAGGVSMVLLAALGANLPGAPLVRLACALLVVGEAIVIAGLWRLSAPAPAPVGATTREFLAYYRGELVKEQGRLGAIARFYLAPVAPGIVLFFVGTCVALGVWTAGVAIVGLGSIAGTYAVIVAVQRRMGRKLAREIEGLAEGA